MNAFEQLKEMKYPILRNFEVYKSYIYQKFIKPLHNSNDKEKLNTYLILMKDEWYFMQLQKAFPNRPSKKHKHLTSKVPVTKENKESFFFNSDPRIS